MIVNSHQFQPKSKFLIIKIEKSKNFWTPINFAHMFETVFRQQHDIWETCDLASGQMLPSNVLSYTGVILTGSHYNWKEIKSIEWFQPVCQLIQQISELGSPKLYGSCFGSQMIAHALGGIVVPNRESRFILKAEYIQPIYPQFSNILPNLHTMDDKLKTTYQIISSHSESIDQLPQNSIHLASSKSCKYEIFVSGSNNNIIGVQGHPEMDYQYCIADRIWNVVVNKRKLLTKAEIIESKKSFQKFIINSDRIELNTLISQYLHRKEILHY